ncbi:FxsB family cyclophane-forming radical SAM/SPASM peptide maturase [Lentzea sp. NPDC004789]
MDEPSPFRQFILKVHERCDLACDHCYVYTKADQRWRTRDRTMSLATADQVARRVAEHVRAHGLPTVEIVLHGGEPLLAGVSHLRALVRLFRSLVPVPVQVSLQTNGTLLDAPTLAELADLRVRVGVSLDGDKAAHDRHRRRHDGSSSYDTVAAAVRLLATEPSVYGGLLCTIDVENDPVRTYEALLEFAPPAVDFLLPNGNWSDPPPRIGFGTPYASWLITVFDRWYAGGGETSVRMFTEIINVLLGGTSAVEGFGTSPPAMVVVETDGAIEVSDMLSSAFEGAAATGLTVFESSFDDALPAPGVVASRSPLCTTCQACELREVCGGGLYAHRYRAGSGFANPSVYCADLRRLITHVRATLAADVARLCR